MYFTRPLRTGTSAKSPKPLPDTALPATMGFLNATLNAQQVAAEDAPAAHFGYKPEGYYEGPKGTKLKGELFPSRMTLLNACNDIVSAIECGGHTSPD